VIKDRAPLPTAEARAGFVRIMKEHSAQLANIAIVLGGTGFWAGAMRSAITSMRFLSPRTFEMRMNANTSEVAAWMPAAHWARTGVRLDRPAFSGVLGEVDSVLASGQVEIRPQAHHRVAHSQRAPMLHPRR
jgi:hypothetical protein